MQTPWVEFLSQYGAVTLQLDCYACGGFYYQAESDWLTVYATVTPLKEDVTLPSVISLNELAHKPCSVYVQSYKGDTPLHEGEVGLNLGQPLMLVVNNG